MGNLFTCFCQFSAYCDISKGTITTLLLQIEFNLFFEIYTFHTVQYISASKGEINTPNVYLELVNGQGIEKLMSQEYTKACWK